MCMLCVRECPDWCIYIEGHNDLAPPRREGGKPRKANVLDRFDIDYALCMYCGICVEVCPFDALVLEPRVRVLRGQHRRSAARQGAPGRLGADRARSARARSRRRGEEGGASSDTRQNIAFCVIALIMMLAARAGGHEHQRRARRAVAGHRARRRRRAVHPAGRGVHRRRAGDGLHRRRRRAVPLRHHAHPGPIGHESDLDNSNKLPGVRRVDRAVRHCSLRCCATPSVAPRSTSHAPPTTGQVGDAIFSTYLVPFEVASVLLLAALVGAIVLARRD